ncbi:MAG: hypothetical protein GX834_04020 [Clostridiaceae bacterium]|nr:hypothetical protein [Clostridiaceae bacterium]HZW97929.1 hypothetical protein [Bacillota bacterium]
MKKVLFYAMEGKKMCFMHVLMNALQLHEQGYEVKIIFEGESVKLPAQLENEGNKLYLSARKNGLLAGICLGCSLQLGVLEMNEAVGLPWLDDMNGHAGMLSFVEDGYEVIWA